jgi:plastocyanin
VRQAPFVPWNLSGKSFREQISWCLIIPDMKNSSNFLASVTMAVLALAASSAGFGATVVVQVKNLVLGSGGFVPATTNINAGDSVIWNWPVGSNLHNVTSTDVPAAWTASPLQSGPKTFTNTFAAGGTYPYECTFHLFTGSINVAAASNPPSVAITNPVDGTVFSEAANVTIQATATNSAGTVTNVQFLIGTTILTNRAGPPYSAVASSLVAGSYTLSAIASESGGAKATNAVAITVVTPLPLALNAPVQLSPGNFQFKYPANVGLNYLVQKSASLAPPNWVGISTNKAAGNPVTFVDTNAVTSPAFYRVVRQPNP